MGDQEIIGLYWERNEDAISETEIQYGKYCHSISIRIVRNKEDADECVNDTWLRAWNAIPPAKPSRLSVWLGKITRNLSLNKLDSRNAGKRGGGEVELSLDELEKSIQSSGKRRSLQIISESDPADQILETKEIATEISVFLMTLPAKKRLAFVGRYFYFISLSELALKLGMSKSHLSVLLYRLRNSLVQYLRERGYEI